MNEASTTKTNGARVKIVQTYPAPPSSFDSPADETSSRVSLAPLDGESALRALLATGPAEAKRR